MGVKGLTSYARSQGLYQTRSFPLSAHSSHPIPLIVDGSALLYHIVDKFGGDLRTGGDFLSIIAHVKTYFRILNSAGFQCMVLIDGIHTREKLPTDIRREKDKLQVDSQSIKMPPLAYMALIQAVRELDIWMRMCSVNEADTTIAELALALDAFVLTNDSDFLIFPSGRGTMLIYQVDISPSTYAKFHNCSFQSNRFPVDLDGGLDVLRSDVYKPERLAAFFGFDPRLLGLFATLCGNDFFSPQLRGNRDLHRWIRVVADAVRDTSLNCHYPSVEACVSRTLARLGMPSRLSSMVAEKSGFYKIAHVHLRISNETEMREWLSIPVDYKLSSAVRNVYELFEHCEYPRKLASVLPERIFFCNVTPNQIDYGCVWKFTLSIRLFLYGVLFVLSNQRVQALTEYRQQNRDFRPVHVEALDRDDLERMYFQGSCLDDCRDIETIPLRKRLEAICIVFDCPLEDADNAMFPMLAIIRYFCANFDDVQPDLVRALVASIMASILPNAAPSHLDFTEDELTVDRIWCITAFQNVLHHFYMTATVLRLPINWSQFARYHNGSYIMHFWKWFSGRHEDDVPESLAMYRNEFLKLCSILLLD